MNRQNLVSNLEKYATRFFASLIALICCLLFFLGPKLAPDYNGVFIAVSTSLFASLVFAIIYSFVVDKHHLNAVNHQLSENVGQAVDEMKRLQQDNVQRIIDLTRKQIEDLEKKHYQQIEDLEKSYYHQISHHFRELIPLFLSLQPINRIKNSMKF
jgi:uncharacterized membrane protein (DUF106 family)